MKKSKVTRKKTGGDSTKVSKTIKATPKKRSNATVYNKKIIHNTGTPGYPYGQLYKKRPTTTKKTTAVKGPVKRKK